MNRADRIKGYRPHIALNESKNTSDEEQFQNQVIRPILKFQNELFIKLFLSNCKTYKINFKEHQIPFGKRSIRYKIKFARQAF